jgi:hypothetical protein
MVDLSASSCCWAVFFAAAIDAANALASAWRFPSDREE